MRIFVRKDNPHVGAQLRITDIIGHRDTVIATNQERDQFDELEVRHRLRARCAGRSRHAKETGFANLPFKSFAPNEPWWYVVMTATDVMA